MWNADRYNRALRFAGEWHGEQTVPGTEISYLMHLSQVCAQAMLGALHDPTLDCNLVMECALLHDILEDTQCTFQLLSEKFGSQCAEGVLALTKHSEREGVAIPKRAQMLDSLKRVRQQPREVWVVKLADRITNLQSPPAHWYEREGKISSYLDEAQIIFDQLSSASEYFAKTMQEKMKDYHRYIPK